MNKPLRLQKNALIFGTPVLIIALLVFITKSSLFQINPSFLAIGITFDLLLTVPFIYFLLIRKTNIPKTTIVPFLIIGVIIGSIIIPQENQQYLTLFKTWVLPIIELSIISYIINNVRKAIKSYKLKKDSSVDFFTTLKSTCYEILPKSIVIPLVTEIAVFYYGFIYWKKREIKENEYSYHKDSGTVTLLVAIILIIAIETVAFHMLLLKWSYIAAWVLTFLSIYSGVQLFGFLRSMYKRPILIDNDKLHLRYGIMTETTININDIDAIEISSKDIELNKETRKLSFLGELESHNVTIRLKKENELIGLYGITRKYRNLALYVDNKMEFKNRIDFILQQQL